MSAVIDAHHHLWPVEAIDSQDWRPSDDGALRRAFELDQYVQLRAAAGVQGSILMQSVDAPIENTRLLAYAQADPRIVGVVAWAPFADAAAARRVIEHAVIDAERLGVGDRLVGFRCLVGNDDLSWLAERQVVSLFTELAQRGLAWDVVPLTRRQRYAVRRLADAVPDLRIVIDHLAAPPVDDAWDAWCSGIEELARIERAAVKLSIGVAVLDASTEWSPEILERAATHAIAQFGPRRCMAASNWPVVELRASYGHAWADTAAIVRRACAPADVERVLAGTALEWYGCKEPQQ